MNTSMLEGHNLGWKLALVLKGIARPEILSTYGAERHPVAYNLIMVDRQLVQAASKLYQKDAKKGGDHAVEDGASLRNVHDITSGVSILLSLL